MLTIIDRSKRQSIPPLPLPTCRIDASCGYGYRYTRTSNFEMLLLFFEFNTNPRSAPGFRKQSIIYGTWLFSNKNSHSQFQTSKTVHFCFQARLSISWKFFFFQNNSLSGASAARITGCRSKTRAKFWSKSQKSCHDESFNAYIKYKFIAK